MKQKISDTLLDVSWAKLSENYFGKSRSWLYHKLDGINGKPDDFNELEKETLRYALLDLASGINRCACASCYRFFINLVRNGQF